MEGSETEEDGIQSPDNAQGWFSEMITFLEMRELPDMNVFMMKCRAIYYCMRKKVAGEIEQQTPQQRSWPELWEVLTARAVAMFDSGT